jgi:hypothetical protein
MGPYPELAAFKCSFPGGIPVFANRHLRPLTEPECSLRLVRSLGVRLWTLRLPLTARTQARSFLGDQVLRPRRCGRVEKLFW